MAVLLAVAGVAAAAEPRVIVTRALDAPIVHPGTHPSIGDNIQGPSLIRVPDWIAAPLGRYYLYFADHKGDYIRLAYADRLTGPWRVHPPGSLTLEQSHFPTTPPTVTDADRRRFEARMAERGMALSHDVLKELTAPHIASPDVHVDAERRVIRMYYHGLAAPGVQVTRVAESPDGIHFSARRPVLGRSYMRVFTWRERIYAMAMPGQFYQSADGFDGFAEGPRLFSANMRHAALLVRGDTLYVFYTRVGDVPERILLSTIALEDDWWRWRAAEPVEVLRPERPWEGADAPLVPSVRSTAYGHVNQLRDPAIFVEAGRTWLLYAVAGESGIGLAEVSFEDR